MLKYDNFMQQASEHVGEWTENYRELIACKRQYFILDIDFDYRDYIQCHWDIPHTESGDPARTLGKVTSRTVATSQRYDGRR